MRIFIFFVAIIITSSISFSQKTARSWNLIIGFNPNLNINDAEAINDLALLSSDFKSLYESYDFELENAFIFSEDDYIRMEREALRVSGDASSIKNLRNIFTIVQPNLNDEDIRNLKKELEQLDIVKYTELMSALPIKPPYDIPPETPNFIAFQTYLDEDPGVNMHYAWDMGLNGQGIRFRNVEYGFNKDHEEFNDNNNLYLVEGYTVVNGLNTDYTEHGTGTFGVVYAHNGDYGITGMAYGAEEAILFPEYTNEYGYDRAMAVSNSINNSQEGDIIMYEMQTSGFDSNEDDAKYVPAEYSITIWNLTKAASDQGIIIVAAAGNGSQDLDAPEYEDYMSRGNSGAIIVGAGVPTIKHRRLGFSTYGSRVNLQGWGQSVLSTGYGDYEQIGGDFNQYYTMFSGTSSATPIVASCVAVVQSYYFSLTGGQYMNSAELIDLFQETGFPQLEYGNNIGPLPNMEAAINSLDGFVGIKNSEKFEFKAYPNPSQDKVSVLGLENLLDAEVEMYSTTGQQVEINTNGNSISIAHLPLGVYFLEISTKENRNTIKIIKN